MDTSSTYLDWGKKNFKLNSLNPDKHSFVKEDCISFLQHAKQRYDIIFIDPPTFSNSKSREDIFDVQRDHRILLILAKGCLAEGGTIIFSTNFRKFQLDESLKENFDIKDMTKESIPFDFERNSKIHRCFFLSARLLNM